MLRKIRRRFIRSAMASFFIVILALLAALNLGNYLVQIRQLDAVTNRMLDYDGPREQPFGADVFPDGVFGSYSPEAPYMLRFFVVHCSEDGTVEVVDQEYIAAVTEGDASEMAKSVLRSGGSAGFLGVYRYALRVSDGGTTILFLNAERELHFIRLLLMISLIALCASMALVLALVVPISRRSTVPFEKNLDMQKQFITDAGHELKTPLTAIQTSVDVLALETGENRWVENIRKQSERLSGLVAQLVSLSRLDEAAPFPKMSDFSLSDVLWEIAPPFASLAEANGKKMAYEIGDGLEVRGDREAVQQMCSILLDNALKHSNKAGRISLRAFRTGKKCCVELENTTDRTLPEELDKLFDRFYRADASRSAETGGYGVGLAIARATAEAHDGRLTAEMTGENSICFRVVL